MKTKNLLLTLLFVLISLPAFALDLQSARANGTLGEKRDGFVTVLKPGAEATKLAAEVNARRAEEYKRISAEKGQPVDAVATVAAEEIIKKLSPGSKYQAADGSWKQK